MTVNTMPKKHGKQSNHYTSRDYTRKQSEDNCKSEALKPGTIHHKISERNYRGIFRIINDIRHLTVKSRHVNLCVMM